MWRVTWFKPAVGHKAVKSSTQACKGQCRDSTCRPSCQRQRSQTAWVRRSVPEYARKKTKSPGGRVGLSAHVKMKNRLHREKEATCSPDYRYGRDCCCPCYGQPPLELQYSVQGFKPAVGRRALKSSTQACKGQCRHSTCRPSYQPLHERMRGSSQTPCKPREKIKTNKAIRLTSPSCLPALNTVSDITVPVKGAQPTRRVCRIQIRAHPENAQRAIIRAPEPEQLTKQSLLAPQKDTPTHT